MTSASPGERLKPVFLQGAHGLRIAADQGGAPDGPAVLIIHGGGQTRHAWRGLSDALIGRGFFVTAMDLRGHGDSDWSPTGAYSVADYAQDVAAIIAGLPRPPVVVGASLGGIAATICLGGEARPAARGLVLVDVVPDLARKGTDRIAAFMGAHPEGFASLDEAADAVSAYLENRSRPRDLSGLKRNLRHRDGRYFWHWDPAMLAAGNHDATLEEARHVMSACASTIEQPVLLVRGNLSDVVTPEGVEKLRALIPHCRYADIAGAGHMVAGDRNDAFNAAVLEFLSTLPEQDG